MFEGYTPIDEIPTCAVGFVDALGTAAQAQDVQFINNLSVGIISERRIRAMRKVRDQWNMRATWFSDNLCVGVPLDDPRYPDRHPTLAISSCAWLLAHLQIAMLQHGIAFRGAISVGSHYQNEFGCIGTALVEAVEDEKSRAIFPRVVLSESVPHDLHGSLQLMLRVDDDGKRWLDFLRALPRGHEPRQIVLGRLRAAIDQEQALLRERQQDDVLSKWQWLSDYVAEYEAAPPRRS